MRPIGWSALAIALCCALYGCQSSAGDFRLTSLDDQAKTVSLADFKGKTVLLDFWATWCGPCNEAMPEVQQVWDKYRSKNVEVVSITDEDRGTVDRFHSDKPYSYPIYLDPEDSAAKAYHVVAYPTFFLVKDGKILWSTEGYSKGELMSAVSQVVE